MIYTKRADPSTKPVPQNALEDPLAYLPCSSILEYQKGQLIYNSDQPSTEIYLIIDGEVKVSRVDTTGNQVLIDIYRSDEFFGESGLLSLPNRPEQATAVAKTYVMVWSVREIEEVIAKRPRLGVALLQVLSQRIIDTALRLESFSVDSISRRLARSLIRFAERQGVCGDDGSVTMGPFTHELLAQYIGTSREIVTHYMNRFRRLGYVRYSRRSIILCPDALTEWLSQKGSL